MIAVDLNQKWINKVRGSNLFLDPTWHPEAAMKTDAAVVAIPMTMPRWKLARALKSRDKVLDRSIYNAMQTGDRVELTEQFWTLADINPIVRPGDRVILNYTAINYDEAFIHNEQYMIKVGYQDVYAAVRAGEIYPVGGWVFCEEQEIDKEVFGAGREEVNRLRKLGIHIPKDAIDAKERKYKLGKVTHVGTNIGYRSTALIPGATYMLPWKTAWAEYDGKRYLVVQEDDIAMRINGTKN